MVMVVVSEVIFSGCISVCVCVFVWCHDMVSEVIFSGCISVCEDGKVQLHHCNIYICNTIDVSYYFAGYVPTKDNIRCDVKRPIY
jgi:hypothetical protein